MRMVKNSSGTMVNYDAAVNLMDDELREQLVAEICPCTEQEFFSAYEKLYEETTGDTWAMSEKSPQY